VVLKKAPKVQTARRARRVVSRWPARYLAEFDDGWVECDVIDLSIDGAALDIGSPAREPEGQLVLEIQSDAQPRGIRLRAVVRSWEGTAADGRLRVGVEFIGTSNLERYTLANLLSQHRRASSAQ